MNTTSSAYFDRYYQNPDRALAWVKERAPILCSCCGAVMTIVKTRLRSRLPPHPYSKITERLPHRWQNPAPV